MQYIHVYVYTEPYPITGNLIGTRLARPLPIFRLGCPACREYIGMLRRAARLSPVVDVLTRYLPFPYRFLSDLINPDLVVRILSGYIRHHPLTLSDPVG